MLSNKVQAILAIVSFVFLAVVIGLQVGELAFYSAQPSVWPL